MGFKVLLKPGLLLGSLVVPQAMVVTRPSIHAATRHFSECQVDLQDIPFIMVGPEINFQEEGQVGPGFTLQEKHQVDPEIMFPGGGGPGAPEDQVFMDLVDLIAPAALVAHIPADRRVPTPVAVPRGALDGFTVEGPAGPDLRGVTTLTIQIVD